MRNTIALQITVFKNSEGKFFPTVEIPGLMTPIDLKESQTPIYAAITATTWISEMRDPELNVEAKPDEPTTNYCGLELEHLIHVEQVPVTIGPDDIGKIRLIPPHEFDEILFGHGFGNCAVCGFERDHLIHRYDCGLTEFEKKEGKLQ